MGMLDYILGIRMDGKQAIGEADKVNASIRNIGTAATAVATAFTSGAAVTWFKNFANYGSEINNLAVRLGVSTDKVQEWQYAAAQTGTEIDTINAALRSLAVRMADVDRGSTEATDAFKLFGFTAGDIRRMKVEHVFEEIAKRFDSVPDSAQKTRASMVLMSESADKLFVAFREGFQKSIDEAKDFNIVIGSDTIKSLDGTSDALTRLSAQIKTLGADFAGELNVESTLNAVSRGIRNNQNVRKDILKARESFRAGHPYRPILTRAATAATTSFPATVRLAKDQEALLRDTRDASRGTESAVKDVL